MRPENTFGASSSLLPAKPGRAVSSRSTISAVLERALNGAEITEAEACLLFGARGREKDDICAVANELRKAKNGDHVSFVVNRNINFTNVCYMGCRFCGFAKRKEDTGAEWLSLETIVGRAQEAWDRGATEVCIQGGLHPDLPGHFYRDIVLAIRDALPGMHIHAFSPFEIWYGASKSKLSYQDFLADLKECGLGSVPGTAAEILDIEVRKKLTKNKLSAEKWVEIIKTAHRVGLPSTATIMYGHVDRPEHWAAHIALLRDIQKETGGFTELVPLSFVHSESPLYAQSPDTVRPGPTDGEVDLMHAVSRIMLNGHIDNIQVSWPKLGPRRARRLMEGGVNDVGGTLMNESISRAAGANHGQEITARELCALIRSAGRIPMRRNTVYEIMDVYENHDPEDLNPLVPRQNGEPLDFLKVFPRVEA